LSTNKTLVYWSPSIGFKTYDDAEVIADLDIFNWLGVSRSRAISIKVMVMERAVGIESTLCHQN
jgi:hypothetical protein